MDIVASAAQSVRTDSVQLPAWQQSLRLAIRDGVTLCELLGLPRRYHSAARLAAEQFPVFAPRGFVARMQPGDPHDPLLRQVLPLDDELVATPGYSSDPVGDKNATTLPGLVQKYSGRALLIATGACAIHCRYCFRREYPYSEGPRSLAQWGPVMAQIESDPSIDEVLLSGGDPLSMVDSVLAELTSRLANIPHVQRLRIHTRLPIVIPERVTADLLAWLRGTRLVPVVVVHTNHPAEIDGSVEAALGSMIDAGIPVLNQAVLLRGVNDRADVLIDLCRKLINLRVIPYYLHQLDRVQGGAHFEVPIPEGRELIAALRRVLPGYAVPRYVEEVGGATSKQLLA